MKIIGFGLNKISIERKSQLQGKLELQNKLDIGSIEKEDIPISNQPGLKFSFTYEILYHPEIAKLEMKGHVIAIDDQNESKDILKDWKSKKFDHAAKLPLLNFILDKCTIKALQLEEELGLPLHLPFPKLQPDPNAGHSQNKANYTG